VISSRFGGPKAPDVEQILGEFLAWMKQQGFAGVKERSHRGQAGRWLVKFHHVTPSALNPEKAVMVYRGWLHVKPGKAMLHIERVPARKVDPNALPDTAAIINLKKTFRLDSLDSLRPLKEEIDRWR
jgi:hypothetical protein